MPSTTINTINLGANAKSANLLAGNINEFVPVNSIVTVSAVSSAIGTNITILADSDVAVDDSEIIHIGTTLIGSDHVIDSFAVSAGTRLAIFLRDTSGAATNDILTKVDVTPIQ